jgi:anti-sigma B factor antagonist
MAQKIMNKQGKMIVRNANADIKDIFTVTGFSNILTLE